MRYMPSLAQGALERLLGYFWPGNILELENLVERSLILSRGEPLDFHDLKASMKTEPPFDSGKAPDLQNEEALALDAIVSGHIRRVLEMTGGKVGGERGVANMLQVNPSTLRKRMRKLGIPFGRKARKGYKK